MDQVGFVKGHQASDGTRGMINLLTTMETRRKPVAFLILETEKAFGQVHWGYLRETLHTFGIQCPIFTAISAL